MKIVCVRMPKFLRPVMRLFTKKSDKKNAKTLESGNERQKPL